MKITNKLILEKIKSCKFAKKSKRKKMLQVYKKLLKA